MPLMFRAMRKGEDGLPVVAASATALGVRVGKDIDVDGQQNVVVNDKGMSVSPSWRMMSAFRIPKRLGGQASNSMFCFKLGSGPFQQEMFGSGLELLPDSPKHGVVRPTKSVPLSQYEADLAATRTDWVIDES